MVNIKRHRGGRNFTKNSNSNGILGGKMISCLKMMRLIVAVGTFVFLISVITAPSGQSPSEGSTFLFDFIQNEYQRGDGNGNGDTTVEVHNNIITVPVVMFQSLEETSSTQIQTQTQTQMIPIRKLSIDDIAKPKYGDALTKPLLLTGWNDHQNDNDTQFVTSMEESNFIKEFGNYTQYVKNPFGQPLKDKSTNLKCLAPTSSIVDLMRIKSKTSLSSSTTNKGKDDGHGQNLLLFTNNLESPDFFRALREKYTIPPPLDYEGEREIEKEEDQSFLHIFSAMVKGSYHGFQRHVNTTTHIYQIHGRKMWWFLPPDVSWPLKGNPCELLTKGVQPQPQSQHLNIISVLTQPGDTIYVPSKWWYATCAIDDWTVAVGIQSGTSHQSENKIEPLPQPFVNNNSNNNNVGNNEKEKFEKIHPMPWSKGGKNAFQVKMIACGVSFNWDDPNSWKWFGGDVNEYYNKLIASDSKRNPKDIKSYAVHRWMGKERSTLIHYELIRDMIRQNIDDSPDRSLHLLDAGCGLGAGLMWFEKNGPEKWVLTGHTISTAQLEFINNLPSHQFNAVLKSFDELDTYKDNKPLDVIYSIEAFIHSPNEYNTIKQWSAALADQGLIVLIDDFLSVGVDKEADDVQLFSKSWMGNVLQSTSSLADIAERHHLKLIVDRDLGSEFMINKRNYQNKLPDIRPTAKKNHQGWLGSGMRQRLMIEGKLTYRLVVFQKQGGQKSMSLGMVGEKDQR